MRRAGGARIARILLIGRGVFGALAQQELERRGHVVHAVSRASGVDARSATSVTRALDHTDADVVLHTAGPFQDQLAAAARAAAGRGVPYVDISDDRPFCADVRATQGSVPLLTGMSTTPALVGALAVIVRRADAASPLVGAMYVGGANRQGPATMAFAAQARADGAPTVVDFPGIGRRRAFPSRAFFDGAFYVAVGGLAGMGWRFRPLVRHAARLGAIVPRLGRDTAGALVVRAGAHREALYARERGQRLAVLPAVWALEEALAGRAPKRAALPHEWVDPDTLVTFLVESGSSRVGA
ncbi:MAG TPA: hypothetical protein VM370_01605 [Candidatus Thermoplasmatota archaeon]|nr:hypothetical protein [Candidatus Thermoplasmatota archaeon]